MYLAPFSSDTINESRVLEDINKLFGILAPYLRRLVIDMPLHSVYPNIIRGGNIRNSLRHAFTRLVNLEAFVSVRDDCNLPTIFPSDFTIEPPVWSTWPRLRKLALHNININGETLEILRKLQDLQVLVLTRTSGG